MSSSMSAQQVLDRDFLDNRAKILELAAALDRIDHATGSAGSDPRMEQMRQSIALLNEAIDNRAEQVQRIFSLPYVSNWKAKYEIP